MTEPLRADQPARQVVRVNMAEVKFVALTKQCQGWRIGLMVRLRKALAACEGRKERVVGVKWRFTMAYARGELRSPYSSIKA